MITRVWWTLALALAACRPAPLQPETQPGVDPAIAVSAVWLAADGQPRLVGGVFCQLFLPETTEPARWGVTDGLEPLVFRDVQPGPYRLVVLGRDGLELAKDVDLPPRRRLAVRVEVQGELAPEVIEQEAATARRVTFVRAAAEEAHPEAQTVSLLEPGRMALSLEIQAGP